MLEELDPTMVGGTVVAGEVVFESERLGKRAGANACRSSAHWLLKNDSDTSAFGAIASKPWNAPWKRSTSQDTPARSSRWAKATASS